jgi:hypothetical protein
MMGMGKGKGKGKGRQRGMMGKGMSRGSMGKGDEQKEGGGKGKARVVDDDETEITGKGSSRGMGGGRPRDPKSSKKKKERKKIKRIKHKSIFDFLMDEPREHLFGGEQDNDDNDNDDDDHNGADDFLRDWQESRIRARTNIFAREGW